MASEFDSRISTGFSFVPTGAAIRHSIDKVSEEFVTGARSWPSRSIHEQLQAVSQIPSGPDDHFRLPRLLTVPFGTVPNHRFVRRTLCVGPARVRGLVSAFAGFPKTYRFRRQI